MAGSEHYSLKWNNYQSTMTSVFHHLLRTEAFVDVTLACDDESLKAHKVVLSACSSYFQKILLNNPSQHPTIIMPSNICFTDLKFIIEFVYRGEIDVSQSELASLLNTANQLKIKGLCDPPEGANMKEMPGAEVTPIPPPRRSSPVPLAMLTRVGRIKRLHIRNRRLDRRRVFSRTAEKYKESLQHHKQEIQIHHVQQQPQTMHQAQQTIHQQQQNVHQTQQNINQQQQQQSMHQQQQTLHQQQTIHHQSQQSMHHHQTQQQMLHQTQQIHTQHTYTQQEPQMIQTVVTSMHDPHSPHSQITSDALANCITVATSTDDDLKNDIQRVVILEGRVGHNGHLMMTSPPPIMTTHAIPSSQQVLLDSSGLSVHSDIDSLTAEVSTQNTSPDHSLMSSPPHHEMTVMTSVEGRVSVETSPMSPQDDSVKVKYETLRAMDQSDTLDLEAQLSAERQENGQLQCGNVEEVETKHTMHSMMITPELIGLLPSSSTSQQAESVSESIKREVAAAGVNKTWSQEDMDAALDALRNHTMSLTKASTTYGIPSTTLWQRAHRLGIDTPKKDGPAKSWTEDNLNVALEALRNGSISANKASKAYGIPSSTLYKIARREGIRLAAPFNAAPTTWSPEDLERALEAIRSGQTTVQRAAADYGIPSGTLYGRCKREGIELSRSNPTPWSEDAMTEALESVRLGHMSINQAAIHYNLPYSSLYGRFKRVKYEADHPSEQEEIPIQTHNISTPIMVLQYQQPIYQHTPS